MDYLICHTCKLELDEKIHVIIPYHDKLYHKLCIMKQYQEQGWYTCSYCCQENKNDFYLDKLICKKECIIVNNNTSKIDEIHSVIYKNEIYNDYSFQKYNNDVIYNHKIYHHYCFKKYIEEIHT